MHVQTNPPGSCHWGTHRGRVTQKKAQTATGESLQAQLLAELRDNYAKQHQPDLMTGERHDVQGAHATSGSQVDTLFWHIHTLCCTPPHLHIAHHMACWEVDAGIAGRESSTHCSKG
jgi:hypothetical protein